MRRGRRKVLGMMMHMIVYAHIEEGCVFLAANKNDDAPSVERMAIL